MRFELIYMQYIIYIHSFPSASLSANTPARSNPHFCNGMYYEYYLVAFHHLLLYGIEFVHIYWSCTEYMYEYLKYIDSSLSLIHNFIPV